MEKGFRLYLETESRYRLHLEMEKKIPSLKLETKKIFRKNIPSLFRNGKVFSLYFLSPNLERTYRATFRDGNLEMKIFSVSK